MSAGRSTDSANVEKLYSQFTVTDGSTMTRIFAVAGAKSVVILWKADSGTPTMTIGAYIHPKTTRETTLSNLGLVNVQKGATVAAGQANYISVDDTVVLANNPVALGACQLDVRVAGNVVNLDVQVIVSY